MTPPGVSSFSHFADVVVAEDPDVITLQEVRLDASFLSPAPGTFKHWHDSAVMAVDGGNQAELLLSHLAQARARAAQVKRRRDESGVAGQQASKAEQDSVVGRQDSDSGYYQFVFQPAMSMLDM